MSAFDTDSDPAPGTITVRGEAIVRTPPDEAMLWMTISAVNPSPGAALADVAERSERLGGLLDELRVPEADRSTAGVSVHEEVEHTPAGPRPRGHRAAATVTVRLADPDAIGRAISRATEELGASIEGPQWSISIGNPARLEAATQAAADAKRRAEAYAAGVGAALGGVIRLADQPMLGAKIIPAGGAWRAARAGPPQMPIEVEEHEVRAAIEATFAFASSGS